MHSARRSRWAVGAATTALAVLALGLGGPPAQRVPIGFDNVHTTTATFAYLKAVAAAYPDLTELKEIGTSTLGRPIYVLVVSNMKTGTTLEAQVLLRHPREEGVKNLPPMKPYMGKPGHWVGGSTHGNEFTGTEASLYLIDALLSGYGTDPEVTRLVDTKAFYICPIINPDGHFNTLERGISQRANVERRDDDADGKVNEDGPDDLDGDGIVAQFRYKDPAGLFVQDETDPRLMIRLGAGEKTTRTRYSVVAEDRDNDGDGKRGEDGEAGIDLNRNFPHRWWRDDGSPGGTGEYPTSAPEIKAVAEFFHTHPNIYMAQFYHTSGGFTYRALGSLPQTELHPRDIAVYDFVMGKKYLEILGQEVPAAWKDPASIPALRDQLRKTSRNKYAIERGYEFPPAWKVSYDEVADRSYGFGLSTDWDYLQLGVYSITTELWNPDGDMPGFSAPPAASDPNARQRALLKFQDEKYGGKAFVAWHAFKHPQLGEGEIGGWHPRYSANAWPGEPLKGVCERHARFEMFRASLMPDLQVATASARVLYTSAGASAASATAAGDRVTIQKGAALGSYRVVEVKAVIENTGPLATHTARGAQLRGNREDVVWLVGDRDKMSFLQGTPWQRLGSIDGAMPIPGYAGRGGGEPAAEGAAPASPPAGGRAGQAGGPSRVTQGGSRREVTWLVALKGDTPLRVVVSSQKGGTVVKPVTVQ